MTVIAAASNSASKLAACFSKDREPPAVMVIFGAGGDLTKRLIVPALYNLARAGMLSDEFAIVGVDHGGRTTESRIQGLDEMLRKAAQGAGAKVDERVWSWLAKRMHYPQGILAMPPRSNS